MLHLRCYRVISPDDLSLIISNIFKRLAMDMFVSSSFLGRMIDDAFTRIQIAHMGSPAKDINHSLIAVKNGVVDLHKKALIPDPGPSEFVVHYRDFS